MYKAPKSGIDNLSVLLVFTSYLHGNACLSHRFSHSEPMRQDPWWRCTGPGEGVPAAGSFPPSARLLLLFSGTHLWRQTDARLSCKCLRDRHPEACPPPRLGTAPGTGTLKTTESLLCIVSENKEREKAVLVCLRTKSSRVCSATELQDILSIARHSSVISESRKQKQILFNYRCLLQQPSFGWVLPHSHACQSNQCLLMRLKMQVSPAISFLTIHGTDNQVESLECWGKLVRRTWLL